MATAISTHTQRQIVVDIEDVSLIRDIRKAIGMIRGVGKISIPRKEHLSAYERSMRDIESGDVFEYKSLNDLIKEVEG